MTGAAAFRILLCMQAATITDVITALDDIINWCRQHNNRTGYFATLYRTMTVGVQKGIANHFFEDAARMENLDVIFANRYLEAWHCYQQKKGCTQSWKTTFDASTNNRLAVIQHLMLGISTHINLDLAIAAAETAHGQDIFLLQKDFERINDVIASLTQATYDRLCRVWFPLRLLGRITANKHDAVVNFSIVKAREASWANAVALFNCTGKAREDYIRFVDGGVAGLNGKIINPGRYINFLLTPVWYLESRDVATNIRHLL